MIRLASNIREPPGVNDQCNARRGRVDYGHDVASRERLNLHSVS
jgi:hypothetical protein